jgi:RimJ/RimL family protein N-acetyltransferase
MTILETSRLRLREFTPQDADALALILSDPDAMRYYPATYDRAGVGNGLNATGSATGRMVSDFGLWS